MDLAPADQNRIFEQIWNPIEENARDLSKRTSLVSDYIRDYLTLKTKKIPNKNKVYEEFKRLYSNKKDETYHQELEIIKSLSYHYKKLINPFSVTQKQIRRELEYINRLEINLAYPFLLQVLEDKENGLITETEVIQVLRLIQSYAWRRFIVGLPTNALNKVFMNLYSELEPDEYVDSIAKALLRKKGSSKFPTDEEIKIALRDKDLYNIQSKNRSYLFELLENFQNKEYVDTSSELITIEHIFPRNPVDAWAQQLSPDDYFDFKEKYLNTLSNLTLSGNNGSLSNRTFIEKKTLDHEGKQQGYLFSRLWLNAYLQKIERWDIVALEERLEILIERFLKTWEFPHYEIIEVDESEEQTLFEAESPTFKKLEYFIFEDTRVEEDAVAQMYFYVIRRLFDRNSESLINSKEILKITKNPADFRSAQEVINGWFIESNIDSNSKFSIMKKLLIRFELEDELIIKYQTGLVNNGEPSRLDIRRKYWQRLLPKLKEKGLFTKVNPTKDHWLGTGAGISGFSFTLVILKTSARIELTINTSNKELNKAYFKTLIFQKSEIEKAFKEPIEWEELPDGKMSRIKTELLGVNLFEEKDWDQTDEFFMTNLPRFQEAFQPFIQFLKS